MNIDLNDDRQLTVGNSPNSIAAQRCAEAYLVEGMQLYFLCVLCDSNDLREYTNLVHHLITLHTLNLGKDINKTQYECDEICENVHNERQQDATMQVALEKENQVKDIGFENLVQDVVTDKDDAFVAAEAPAATIEELLRDIGIVEIPHSVPDAVPHETATQENDTAALVEGKLNENEVTSDEVPQCENLLQEAVTDERHLTSTPLPAMIEGLLDEAIDIKTEISDYELGTLPQDYTINDKDYSDVAAAAAAAALLEGVLNETLQSDGEIAHFETVRPESSIDDNYAPPALVEGLINDLESSEQIQHNLTTIQDDVINKDDACVSSESTTAIIAGLLGDTMNDNVEMSHCDAVVQENEASPAPVIEEQFNEIVITNGEVHIHETISTPVNNRNIEMPTEKNIPNLAAQNASSSMGYAENSTKQMKLEEILLNTWKDIFEIVNSQITAKKVMDIIEESTARTSSMNLNSTREKETIDPDYEVPAEGDSTEHSSDEDEVDERELILDKFVEENSIQDKDGVYICNFCNHRLSKKSYLRLHVITHSTLRLFECDKCGKSFKDKLTWKKHVRSHVEKKEVKCPACPARFLIPSQMRAHLASHKNERRFICSMCPLRFNTGTALGAHIRVHKEEKQQKCSKCGKAFLFKYDLEMHMKSHTNERPYKCDQCDKTFKRPGSLREHKKLHATDGDLVCSVCKKPFNIRKRLVAHMKKKHQTDL